MTHFSKSSRRASSRCKCAHVTQQAHEWHSKPTGSATRSRAKISSSRRNTASGDGRSIKPCSNKRHGFTIQPVAGAVFLLKDHVLDRVVLPFGFRDIRRLVLGFVTCAVRSGARCFTMVKMLPLDRQKAQPALLSRLDA